MREETVLQGFQDTESGEVELIRVSIALRVRTLDIFGVGLRQRWQGECCRGRR